MLRRLIWIPLFLGACNYGLTPYGGDTGASGGGLNTDGDGGAAGPGGGGNPGGGVPGGGGNPGGGGGDDTGSTGGPGGDGPGGDGPGGGGADTLSIDSVDPEYGTVGASTIIYGGPFDSSVRVWMGDREADVLSVTSGQVSVTVPVQTDDGAVDITVETDDGAGSLTEGFFYFRDGTGLTGATGYYEWYAYTGGYWDGVPTDFGAAYVAFVDPVDFHWWEYYAPGADTCVDSDAYDVDVSLSVFDFGATSLNVSGGSASTTLAWDSTAYGFVKESLVRTDFSPDSWYTASAGDGSTILTDGLPNLFQTGGNFSVTSPAIDGGTVPRISRAQSLRWNASGADKTLFVLAMFNAAGTDFEQVVYCVLNDDGNFNVPTSVWNSWPNSRQITIYAGRYMEQGATLPYNNSEARIGGTYFKIGAALTQ